METDERKGHWDGIYASKADKEVSWFEAAPETSLMLIAKTGVPLAAAIIDIGTGISKLPDALVAAGYTDITLLDVSQAALAVSRARLGDRVSYIAADITAWTPPRPYDVWHDRAVLHFLTEERDRAAYRHALLAATRAGSHAIFATFAPSGPDKCSGLPVRRYGESELGVFLGGEFRIVESFERDHVTPWNAVQRFFVARALRG